MHGAEVTVINVLGIFRTVTICTRGFNSSKVYSFSSRPHKFKPIPMAIQVLTIDMASEGPLISQAASCQLCVM